MLHAMLDARRTTEVQRRHFGRTPGFGNVAAEPPFSGSLVGTAPGRCAVAVVAGRCVGCAQFAARALQRAAAGDQEELDSAVGSAAQCIDAAVRAVPCRAVPCLCAGACAVRNATATARRRVCSISVKYCRLTAPNCVVYVCCALPLLLCVAQVGRMGNAGHARRRVDTRDLRRHLLHS